LDTKNQKLGKISHTSMLKLL